MALLAPLLISSGPRAERPAPIHAMVDGEVRRVMPGLTLGSILDRYAAWPEAGDLLDVDGRLLEQDAFPGRALVNGEPAGSERPIEDGDRISALDGRDGTERTRRHVIEIPPDTPANPQWFLGSAPGRQVVVSGRRSGKVVSASFHPTGPAKQPRLVALTFDDGPHPVHTPRILSILEDMDVPATFFVVGGLAERYPHLIERELELGMTVASHSMYHPYRPPFHRLPRAAMAAEIRRVGRVLARIGVNPKAFRPPGGSWSPKVLREAEAVDQRLVLWSVDSRDWAGRNARQIARGVLRNVRPGSIVLLHDGGGDRSATVAALPRIIRGLRARDLRPVAI